MASVWKKTLFYLGLVDETDGDELAPSESAQPVPQPQAQPMPTDPQRDDARRAEAARRSARKTTRAAVVQPGTVSGRRVEPPLTARWRMSSDSSQAEAGVMITTGGPNVRTLSDDDLESQIIEARSYTDAQQLADHIRANVPVVLDLRKVEPAMVRRLVDFASGLTYALGGSMRKVGQGVILVTPPNVNITRNERRRLSDLGFYQSPESG